ncbi:MAG: hypothetical protein IKH22_05420 [Prevotella sp.]|nr:hypothetical protein [Prevotella sp.]
MNKWKKNAWWLVSMLCLAMLVLQGCKIDNEDTASTEWSVEIVPEQYYGQWSYDGEDIGTGTMDFYGSRIVVKSGFSWQIFVDEWMAATGKTGWKEDELSTQMRNNAEGSIYFNAANDIGYSNDAYYFRLPPKENYIGVQDADGKQYWMKVVFEQGNQDGLGVVYLSTRSLMLRYYATSIGIVGGDQGETITLEPAKQLLFSGKKTTD